jgi:Ca-activated chloride channel family protein
MSGQEPMEREVDRWFKRQRDMLHAPNSLWDALEPSLGAQTRRSWLMGFRWVFFRLSYRAASAAVALAVMVVAVSVIATLQNGSGSSGSSTQDSSRSLVAQATATASASRGPTGPAGPAGAAGSAATAVPGSVPLFSGGRTEDSALNGRPSVTITSDALAELRLSLANIRAAYDGAAPLTREQAEALAEQAASGGYGIAQEQYEIIITELMRGDWSSVDPLVASTWFQSYGINPFISPAEHPLSTFAMDVDTASYTVTRGYLGSGQLPPFESVRVEEYVNYFEQGYPQPQDALGINIDGSRNPFIADGSYLLRVGINAREITAEERKPVNIVLVVDTSGSMRTGNRIALVRRGIESLIDQLRPGDTIGIVSYGDEARTVVAPTTNFGAALESVSELVPGGSTNAQAGLRLGFELAGQYFGDYKSNHVILLSDGVANVGTTEADPLLAEIKESAEDGISLSTIGVGIGNYNDVLLERLADNGDGSYAYIDTYEEAERTLGTELTRLLEIVALNAKVQVEFNPDIVESYRLVGYENRALESEDFKDDSVDAGEVGAGHTVTAFYEVKFRSDETNGSGEVGKASIRWTDPETGEAVERSQPITIGDILPPFESASPRFRLTASVAAFAEVLRHNPRFATLSAEDLVSYIENAVAELPGDEAALEFLSLVNQAVELKAFDSLE